MQKKSEAHHRKEVVVVEDLNIKKRTNYPAAVKYYKVFILPYQSCSYNNL